MTEGEKQVEAHGLLKSAGFSASHMKEDWFNHEQRKFFTRRVVRDMPLVWLRKRLKEAVPKGEYWFFSYYSRASGAWEVIFANFELIDLRPVPKSVEIRREPRPT
ncbi:MAG: hypothetical protein WAU82_10575 [Candidatus Binatus sp.]|uniref:hypothetical protein n=1 Tax=Candidatus Binatus sp. TaxID=2811406 RepID=UPI003BEE93A2